MASSLAAPTVAPLPLRTPTIKGIFVNSHVQAVRRALGEPGVGELARRAGHPIDYSDFQDVPVREEVSVIEIANDLLSPLPIPAAQRAYEGGRLHYRNFKATPLARLMFTIFPRNFRYLMLHAPTIAERVFKGVLFTSEDLGPAELRITMENNDYPVDHFRGLFQAWMDDFGVRGRVEGRETDPRRFEYRMRWEL